MEEVHPNIQIITTGSCIKKHCYSWSFDDKCLYFKGTPVCYKVYGLLACNKDFIDKLRPFFKKLDLISYIFENNVEDFARRLAGVFEAYYNGAVNADICDEIVLQVMNTLKCKYERKYLNYCKNLDAATFRDVTRAACIKRNERSRYHEPHMKLEGLWYRPESSGILSDIGPTRVVAGGF